MSHFARIEDSFVVEVIVCSDLPEGEWYQTSYNGNIRGKFAGVGDLYDDVEDLFVSGSPYPSWVIDEDGVAWKPPVEMPEDGAMYRWNEESLSWLQSTP